MEQVELTVGLAVLAVWLLLTAIAQVRAWPLDRFESAVRARDMFGLVPNWSFFAPMPAMTDLHVVYRDRNDQHEIDAWHELATSRIPRSIRSMWNPNKRIEKALIDTVLALLDVAASAETVGEIVFSDAYLLLLEHVSAPPRFGRVAACQFAIVQSGGRARQPELLFVSDWHRLELERPRLIAEGRLA